MKKGQKDDIMTLLFLAAVVLLILWMPKQDPVEESTNFTNTPGTISVVSWNLQIFGQEKASHQELMNSYHEILKVHDIIIIQEIKDLAGNSWNGTCEMFNETHFCGISSRAGKSSSKEQYGFLVRRGLGIVDFVDYNNIAPVDFERPPVKLTVQVAEDYNLTIWTIHTKPDDATDELKNLNMLVADEGNVVVIGDLNADCDYYTPDSYTIFNGWFWAIRDSADTTVSPNTDCAYDRIIINRDLGEEYVASGIQKVGVNDSMSDHYPVWMEFNPQEINNSA